MLLPDIRAAKEWGQRPTAVIMKDRWYGHRLFSGEKYGDPDEFIHWDYALISALQLIEDSTDKSGLLWWQTEPDWIEVEAVKQINKFEAARERATSGKNYKPTPGEGFVPRLATRNKRLGIPTYRDTLKRKAEEAEKENGTIDG